MCGKSPFGRLEGDRFVTIQKAVDLPPVVRVVGNRAESVVLRNAGQVILPEILAQGLDIPRQEDLDAPAAAQRLLNPLCRWLFPREDRPRRSPFRLAVMTASFQGFVASATR